MTAAGGTESRGPTPPRKHAVIVTIYREPASRIFRAVASVRQHEPRFPVVVVSDGVDRPDIGTEAGRLGFRFVAGEHLKTLTRAASWWTRFFNEGLAEDADCLMKLDPDALFWRPFRCGPPGEHYGTLQSLGGRNGIQGGCQGFSRDAALRLLQSGLCEHGSMGDPSAWYPNAAIAEQFRRGDYLSTDWTIAHIAAELGIVPCDWLEVRSTWGQPATTPVTNPGLRYAVTHPYRGPGE